MTRIAPVTDASPRSAQLLEGVQRKLGMTPNLMSTMAHSPATLDAYLKLSDALSKGELESSVREQIALTVAEANSCEYCLSAHTAIGKMVGLSTDDINAARRGTSADPHTAAVLELSSQIVASQGRVSDEDLAAATAAGVTPAQITEVVANTALNLFTNYFNHVAETDVDFPAAPALEPAHCDTGCQI